jgi:hypothetical protein
MRQATHRRTNHVREIDRHVVRRARATEVEQTHRDALTTKRFTANQPEILAQIFKRG